MKIKIKKRYKNDIEYARGEIIELSDMQEDVVEKLAKKLKIRKNSQEYEIFWDCIVNGSDWMIEFVK